ncbi:MAG: hypothetical protein LC647_06350, partial [Beggiatoa sp.]|nr:hypothetical protein [Beggiatoa sp.]
GADPDTGDDLPHGALLREIAGGATADPRRGDNHDELYQEIQQGTMRESGIHRRLRRFRVSQEGITKRGDAVPANVSGACGPRPVPRTKHACLVLSALYRFMNGAVSSGSDPGLERFWIISRNRNGENKANRSSRHSAAVSQSP